MPQLSRETADFSLDRIVGLSEAEKAYFAGYFDGEGSVGLYKKKRNGELYAVALRVSVAQITDLVLRELFEVFGGVLTLMDRPDRAESKHTQYYTWSCDVTTNARMFFTTILPYVREKKAEIDAVMHYIDNRNDLTLQEKFAICDRVSALKQRHEKAFRTHAVVNNA